MKKHNRGFTLLELSVVVGIIAILAASALVGYQYYVEKAASAELIEQYDELRQRASLAVSEGTNLCDDPEKALSPNSVLYNPHAELSIVKQDPDIIGLLIKADVVGEGEHNTAIARAAHDTLERNNKIVPGSIVNDSVVSFTALLVNVSCSAASAAVTPSPAAPGPVPKAASASASPSVASVPKSQQDCQPHQFFNPNSKLCINVCNPGWYWVPGANKCSSTPPQPVPAN